MSAPRHLIDNILIKHSAFETAVARIGQCFDAVDGSSEPICISLIGESRTGKSRVLSHIEHKHPRYRTPEGLTVPVLRVRVPSKPTVKNLAETLLQSLGDPRYAAGTENQKTARLTQLVKECRTKVTMLDEFQHFQDKTTHKVWHYVSDWLKTFADDSGTAVVLAGLESSLDVIYHDAQLSGRLTAPIIMPRFDWTVEDHREEFCGIVGSFGDAIGKHFDVPDLGNDDMAFRLFCGTGGLIGLLTKCLRQTVWNAIDAGATRITLADLARAHSESTVKISNLSEVPNPFLRSWNLNPTPELVARIRQFGCPHEKEQESESTGRRSARSVPAPTASQALRAKKAA